MKQGKRLITHAVRKDGALPETTPEGLAQFAKLPHLDGVVSLIVIGTGVRFMEIYWELIKNGQLDPALPIKYSPFCGSADGLDQPDTIVLANGIRCKMADYIGFGSTSAFDTWKFIDEQPDGTLFLAGGELMIALGHDVKVPKAALFLLKPEVKEFDFIAQG